LLSAKIKTIPNWIKYDDEFTENVRLVSLAAETAQGDEAADGHDRQHNHQNDEQSECEAEHFFATIKRNSN
jgi:hypothetical protein